MDLKENDNMLHVIVADVRMPVATVPIGNPVVTSYELLGSSGGSNKVYSVIDTNRADPGETLIPQRARPFKRVEIHRKND